MCTWNQTQIFELASKFFNLTFFGLKSKPKSLEIVKTRFKAPT